MMRSWVDSASGDTDFPIQNLPYGVFSTGGGSRRCGVAIGDMILDVTAAEEAKIIKVAETRVFDLPYWNVFMGMGPKIWAKFRATLQELLVDTASRETRDTVRDLLVPQSKADMHMPFRVSEYTDFYAGRHHAFNVGSMFRDPANALPPNWLHIPIGYNGRASSVVVSGTPVTRPMGQLKGPNDDAPRFGPCARFDIELEMGAIVGTSSDEPLTLEQAYQNIFGYVLLNDWSARDIQAWEYQPLGPFQAKATATTISPWIVTAAALEPFRVDTPEREVPLLPYIADKGPMLYDIALEVGLKPEGGKETVITRTNYRQMYYSAAQQLTHHSSSGCPMRVGDLLGSGTISGPSKPERGSLLELSWGGKEPLTLDDGQTRSFVEDGDTLTLRGAAHGDGYRVGFGECTGQLRPAKG